MKQKGWIVLGSVVGIALFLVVIPIMNYGNKEVRLRKGIEASQLSNQVVFDRVWKTIQQQAGVTDKYQDSFRSIYKDIMDARNPEGQGKLFKMVSEANPNFDSSLFSTLMTSIESNRKDFEREQKFLIDRKREHDVLLETMPSSIYLSILGRKQINIQLVTSTRTDDSFKSGKDDNVELFNSNK